MEYKLIRTKRKTIAIQITDGGVVVKAPPSSSVERIEAFLAQKQTWIEKKLAEQRYKNAVLADVISGVCAMYHGQYFKIELSAEHKRIAIGGGKLYLPSKYAGEREAATRALKAWYKRMAAVELKAALDDVSERIGKPYASFSLTNAQGKWGSCDGSNNIMLNWRLVMLDLDMIEYVCVHELCHTNYHDHSPSFWAEVGKFYPAYPTAKKRLKNYSTLTKLYR